MLPHRSDETDSTPLIAGVELGGTKCVLVLAHGRELLERQTIPTSDDAAATLGKLVDVIANWREQGVALEAIGVGSFGPLSLDPDRPDFGCITTTPKPGWADVDVRGAFARSFALPIGFDTDVNGAALAEGRWGAATGARVHVYLTIGTGVGGGLVVNGKPVHGLLHPEIGHVRVRRTRLDGFAGNCPFHGDCIEGLTAGPAIAARTGQAATALAPDHPVWADIADELAELMAILMLTVSPDRILIGGGVGMGQPHLLPLIRRGTAARLNGYIGGIRSNDWTRIIQQPALGADAGPLGAVALGLDALLRAKMERVKGIEPSS